LNKVVGARMFVGELSSTDPETRLRAVAVLGVMRGAIAVEALMTMVTDPDVRVRTRAVTLLGRLGDYRAVKVLKRVFTSDPVSDVAAAAEESLRALGALPDVAPSAMTEPSPADVDPSLGDGDGLPGPDGFHDAAFGGPEEFPEPGGFTGPGDFSDPDAGDFPEPDSGDLPEPDSGDAPEPDSGDFPESEG
ncbi:MAG TPA: HEAT repeat domain-containing protein, partial [Actinomycetota bacterium]